MATKASSGALSTFIMDPSDAQYVQALRDAQANLREALDSRSNQLFDPTLLAISQALGSPTKTGSFGEVLGNVAGAIGTSQQAEDKRSREIATMKMELASNELAQNRATQGMKAGFDLLNRGRPSAPAGQPSAPAAEGSPQAPAGQAAQPTAGGLTQPSAGPSNAPTSVTRNVTTNDILGLKMLGQNNIADAIVKGIELDRGRYHVSNDMIVDKDADGGPKVIADLRVSKQEPTEIVVGGKPLNLMMTGPELRDFNAAFAQGKGDEFFEKNLKGRRTDANLPSTGSALREIYVPLLGDVRFQGTDKQAAIIERLSEEALRTRNPSSLRDYVDSITKPMAMPAAAQAPARPTAAPTAAPAAQAAPGQPAAPAVVGRPPAPQPAAQPAEQPAPTSDLSGLPLADQTKIISERLSAANKPAQDTIAVLLKSSGPDTTVPSNQRLKELVNIIDNNPKVVGLMNKQGTVAGIAAAAQQGLQVGSTSVSLPVTEFLSKNNLTPQEQQIARRVAQLLDQEFFTRAALAKSALGPQISNTDAIAMKSPMARPEDGAQLIKYWSLHGVLVNRQNDELVNSYNSWLDKTKGKQGDRTFWNTEGRRILNQYTPYFEKLEKDFSPTRPR
jgi:hypothetical protein